MATTVQNVLDNAIQLLNDPTVSTSSMDSGNAWTGDELFGYLKESLRILAKRTSYWRGKGAIYLAPNQGTYALPADCIEPLGYRWGTLQLQRTTEARLDAERPGWEAERGAPAKYARDGVSGNQVVIIPAPDAAAVAAQEQVTVRYIKTPAIPENLSDFLDIPDHYANGPMYYVLARAYGKDGELQSLERSQTYMDAFEGFVKAMTADASAGFERQTHNLQSESF